MIWWLIRIAYAIAMPATLFVCDPPGERLPWTRAQRQGARELAQEYLEAKGAARNFRVFVDIATVRESSAAPSRWHDHGTGLGMHGLNVAYFGAGGNLCDPRYSAEQVRQLARRCIRRHGVATLWGLQACFAGRFECTPNGQGRCTAGMMDRTTEALCSRIGPYGISCDAPISEKDLGRP